MIQIFCNLTIYSFFAHGITFGNIDVCGIFGFASFLPKFTNFETSKFLTHFTVFHFSFTIIETFICRITSCRMASIYVPFHEFITIIPVFWVHSPNGFLHEHFDTLDAHGCIYGLICATVCLIFAQIIRPEVRDTEKVKHSTSKTEKIEVVLGMSLVILVIGILFICFSVIRFAEHSLVQNDAMPSSFEMLKVFLKSKFG